MRPNHVKQKLNDGGMSIGTFMFEFNTTGIGRLAAEAGAAFAVFDMEHTGWSVDSDADRHNAMHRDDSVRPHSGYGVRLHRPSQCFE